MAFEPETEMLRRCLEGDADAWEDLFSRHYAAVGRFICGLGGLSPQDIEEVCQETFLSVIRSLGSFGGQSRLQTWIFRIAANKARDFRERALAAKRGGGQLTFSLDASDEEGRRLFEPVSEAPGPDARLLRAEQAQLIRRALDELGEPCREIIELRYFGDLSYDEISGALGMNIKTVSSRLSKCLDHLETVARRLFSEGERRKVPSNSPGT